MRRYLEIAGAELIFARTPPSGFRLGRGMNDVERLAWLEKYPELRIYRGRRRFKIRGFIMGVSRLGKPDPMGRGMILPEQANEHAVPQAYLYDRGVETKLIVSQWISDTHKSIIENELVIRRRAKLRGFILGQSRTGRKHFKKDDARSRVYTLRTQEMANVPGQTKLAVDVLRPDLDPIDVRSEYVGERFRIRGLLCGRARIGKAYLCPDRAIDHIYTRTRLFDPARPLDVRSGGGSVIGRDYLRIPPHNAIVRAKIRQKLPSRGLVIGRHMAGFIAPPLNEAYEMAVTAIRSSKRLSDRIFLETRTVDGVSVSTATDICDFTIGEMRGII